MRHCHYAAACSTASQSGNETAGSDEAPTLDSRPIVRGLKPPVGKLKTPGKRVDELVIGGKRVRIGQKMVDLFNVLPDPAVQDSEDDDYVLVTDVGTFPGTRYVRRYSLADGRQVVIRYARRLPKRPYRIISDNQPGAGERQNKRYPYLVEEIVIE